MPQRSNFYREVKIPKRSGGFRSVVVPQPSYKKRLRGCLDSLNALAMALDVYGVAHGFVPCRSVVTAAHKHVGFKYTLSFDLENCFDHVTQVMVRQLIASLAMDLYFIDGVARQGLPTSPAMANIALAPLDAAIVQRDFGGAYTRYADDLTFSVNKMRQVQELLKSVPLLCAGYGFPIAPRKTKLQCATRGRRIVCGVAVGETAIYPTRKTLRRIRAAEHQDNKNQARGLREWSRLKGPNWERWAMQKFSEGITAHSEVTKVMALQTAYRAGT